MSRHQGSKFDFSMWFGMRAGLEYGIRKRKALFRGFFWFNGKSARGQKATGGMADRSNHGMGRR